MSKVFNFSAGPAVLPAEVLQKAQQELVDYRGTGMSVMEMSHRSKEYEAIIGGAEQSLRKLMDIPANYKVLFLQGGASTQFAMVPMNLYRKSKSADYLITGAWAKKAASEAKKFGSVKAVASSEDRNFCYIPDLSNVSLSPEADYVHITTNNTIYGTLFPSLPDTGDVPLVADMSSNILSQVYDVNKFGLIYAGAQKNAGPAGVTMVIIREDLIGHAPASTPTMLDYKVHAGEGSMYNTPPCYSIYICGLVFDWLLGKGGIPAMEKENRAKAALLYNFLDQSAMFKGTVDKADRSLMNIPFVTGNEELDAKFISEASKAGLKQLKGHRSVGGMRASIYNAMPHAGVEALVNFMQEFEKANS